MAFYRKKQLQEMTPWVEGLPIDIVRISQADIDNGSPKTGDMIAFNLTNGSDMWLITEKFFEDNYEWITD